MLTQNTDTSTYHKTLSLKYQSRGFKKRITLTYKRGQVEKTISSLSRECHAMVSEEYKQSRSSFDRLEHGTMCQRTWQTL